MDIEEQFERFRTNGYFVVDEGDMVDGDMLDELETAARRVRDKIRSGTVDIKTILGEGGDPIVIWGLIAPEFNEPIFAEYLVSERVERYARFLLGDELRLGAVE